MSSTALPLAGGAGGDEATFADLLQSIQTHEVSDDPRVVHGIAVPQRLIRFRGNVEIAVPIDERAHSELRRCWPWGRVGDPLTLRIVEPWLLMFVELDSVAVLVNKAMVVIAEADQIPERGLTTIGPVVDVVTLDIDAIAATRESARGVARQ